MRKGHSLSSGDFDILWGALSSDLDDPCLKNTSLNPVNFSFPLSSAIGSNQTETLPTFIDEIDIQPISFALSEICIDSCCSFSIYGDSLFNDVEKIKSYNGYTYLMGRMEISGLSYGTFSKFDSNGSLIWDYRLDMPARMFDFTATTDSAFMIVGRTEPVNSSGTWLNNKSILMKIDDDGNEVFIRTNDHPGREAFFSIVRHPAQVNPAFPYYMTGAVNPSPTPSAFDEVQVTNLAEDGTVNWTHQYAC